MDSFLFHLCRNHSDAEITALEAKIAKARHRPCTPCLWGTCGEHARRCERQVKQGMMSELLTGSVRLA